MSAMQRTKGASGENEIKNLIRDLSGWDVRRRCRQHDGDSDLLGVSGWAIEVKRQKAAPRGQIASWWRQAVSQARGLAREGQREPVAPVLFFRADRDEWRAVWPIAVMLTDRTIRVTSGSWLDYCWTAESSVDVWVAVAREINRE